MRSKNTFNDFSCFINISVVSHTKGHVDTTNRVERVISYLLPPNFTVWNDNLLIVEGLQNSGEQVNLSHFTKLARSFDKFVHFIRAKYQQHDTSS